MNFTDMQNDGTLFTAMKAKQAKQTLTAINPTPHLNRARVKRTALEIAKQIRSANKWTRVGLSFLQRIEAKTRAAITEEVRQHPSKGKTLL